MKMKKLFAGLAAAALFVSVGATTVFASDGGAGPYYQDANGDGICDRRAGVCSFVDEDCDGACDSCGFGGRGAGCRYQDADGDGGCDYYGTGARAGRGCGRRGGCCGRFCG